MVQRHIGSGVTVCAIVKADAYGHGAVECSRALEEEGVRWFGVTSLDEAIPLREAGIRGRILLLTGFWRGEEEEIVRLNLTPTVWEPGQIELFEKAASRSLRRSIPSTSKSTLAWGASGRRLEDLRHIVAALKSAPHLVVEGLSTHLASSEVLDAPSVAEQLQTFEQARQFLRNEGIDPPLIHAANTGAVISRRESWNTMVRPGIALYGYFLPFERAGREVSGSGLRLARQAGAHLEDPHSFAARRARQPGPGIRRHLRHQSSGAHCGASRGIRRRLQPRAFFARPRDCARTLRAHRGPHFHGPHSGGCNRPAGNRRRGRGHSAGVF